jgi:hypothetical protein
MSPHRRLSACVSIVACAWLLGPAVQAQPVYRCGNSYGTAPCPGGQAVAVDDARSDAQRQQALAVKRQQADLADALAAERRAREQSKQAHLAPAGIGPTAAERQQRELQAALAVQAATKKKHDLRRHARRATHLAGGASRS